MAPQQPRTAARIEYDDIFTVLVGDTERRSIIHGTVITKKSEFFRPACNGKFKEAKDKVIRLPEADHESFRSCVQWCYNDTVCIQPAAPAIPEATCSKGGVQEQRALCKLYSLANLLLDTTLQNRIIDALRALIRNTKQGPGLDTVNYVYNHLLPGCTLQRFVLAWYVYRQDTVANYLERYRESFPDKFWSDLVLITAKAGGVGKKIEDPQHADFCEFHEHSEGIEKCLGVSKA